MKGYLLQDDSNGITPIGRLNVPMGEISYFNLTGTTVTISAQSDGSTNMVAVSPTTTLNNDMGFDNGGANNGRVRYTGTTTRNFHTALTFSISPTTNNDSIVIGLAKNGTVQTSSKVARKLGTTSDIHTSALHCMVSLATNDYIELYVGNLSAANNVVVKSLNIFAMGM